MFIVVTEWDGEKPPTTYYKRLHQLGLKVRGDKSLSPLERRATEGGSVIVQEGAVLCASESLAREVAMLAEHLGATIVQVGEVELENIRMTDEDMRVFQRVESVFGRRGRPPTEAFDWCVTCLEEARSFNVHDATDVVNCPNCKGLKIKARQGRQAIMRLPLTGSAFDDWMMTRFYSGTFEVPDVVDSTDPLFSESIEPDDVYLDDIRDPREQAIVERIQNSPQVIEYADQINDLWIIDLLFVAQLMHDEQERMSKRVAVVTKLFERGLDPSEVKLRQAPDHYDLADLGTVIQPRRAAEMYVHHMHLSHTYE